MKRLLLPLIMLIISASSCTNRNDEIISLSKGFFYSLMDTTFASPSDYYPLYETLETNVKSDVVEIEESNISYSNDTIFVKCFNNYTTSNGNFKQEYVTLVWATDKDDNLHICNSKGLLTIDDDMADFGKAVGAFSNKEIFDVELSKISHDVRMMYLKEYFEAQITLLQNVKIINWSWETSYSGEAHGEGRVRNNLNFAIEGVKYELKYYDYRGDFMAEDNGSISKTLYPGEIYNFTFWSSNAKYPDKASLKLVFPDKLVDKIIKRKGYTGKEYQDYLGFTE